MSRSRSSLRARFAYPLAIVALHVGFALAAPACSTAELKPPPPPGSTDPTGGGVAVDEEGNPVTPATDGGRDPGPAAASLAMTSNVTIQVEPTDSGAAILAAIKGAKKSVHMTMYLLTSDDVIYALSDLKKAGKEVKVILNKTFPQAGTDNQDAYDRLVAKGVSVAWASSTYTFTHAKTVIIDNEKVLIMTMNLTYSSPTQNREFIATDTDQDDVATMEKLFAADFTGAPVSVQSKLVVSPTLANIAGDPRDQLKTLIDSATTSLDIEAESLSDKGIVDAIVLAHQAKVDVHVVIDHDTSKSSAQLSAIAKMQQAGVPIRALASPNIHAKVIVVDGVRVFVGSQNMTLTALEQNREVGVITDAKAEAAKVRQVIMTDFNNGAAP